MPVALLVALLIAVIPLVALAKRANISYPIVLVLGGLLLGFVPGLPKITLDPDLVFLLFLPPLLYWGAITAPTDVMREDAGQISVLVVLLVFATTVGVAVVAHAIDPSIPWGVAFVLGAIVSPTDELAAVPVLEHFGLPRHVIAIVEGESLFNDASALVIYAAAVGVVATGAFHLWTTLLQLVVTAAGSVAIGYLAGRFAVELWQRIKDQQLQSVISVVLPFLAYIPAQGAGLSGVLAVVTAGVFVNRHTPRLMTPGARTQLVGFWNTLVFVVNAVLFLVVGLQLNDVARTAFERNSWESVILFALLVNVAIIAIRLGLVVLAEYAPTAAPPDHAAPNWKNALIVAWSGLRGAVSLTAALAIPAVLPNGLPFPHRELVVFTTFTVILVTLVGGGLTLPMLIGWLRVDPSHEEHEELQRGLLHSFEAALRRIDELEEEGRIDAGTARARRSDFEHLRELHLIDDASAREGGIERHLDVEREITAARRAAILELRDRGEIDNVVERRLLADLDLPASRPALRASRSNRAR